MELVTKMVEHHVWLTGEMVRVAGRLDDQQLDRQIEVDVDDDVQTIRSLLSRLVGRMGMWNAALATRDYDWSVEEHESLTSSRSRSPPTVSTSSGGATRCSGSRSRGRRPPATG